MRFLPVASLALVLFAPTFRALGAEPILKIISPGKTLTFTAEEFAALPRTEVTLVDPHEKTEQHYTGVLMRELLVRAGALLGDKFRGPAVSMAVLVHCKDTYTVLFSLAEFDANFNDRTIILADKLDGDILPPSAAPLRIVAPADKRGARSARQVTSIEIISVGKS
jgi:DMSO/TMAO reductase YedYZ molybdopterin-dependent catalytic subunit